MTALRVFGIWKGRAVIQGVVLLNKRLNLPFRRLVESPFKLLSTGTTRLGYMLLVFSPSIIHTARQGGIPLTAGGNPHQTVALKQMSREKITLGQHCT